MIVDKECEKREEILKNIQAYEDIYGVALSQGYLYRSFGLGEQWTARDLADLQMYDMAPLVDNQIGKHYKKIFGEFASHLPTISLTSLALTNSPEEISTLEDLIRKGSSRSAIGQTISKAFEESSRTGNSCAYYLYTDYKDSHSFEQEWYLDFISGAALRFDPTAELSTKSDGEWVAYIRQLNQKQFEEQFPKSDWNDQDSVGDKYFSRTNIVSPKDETIFIAHYFEKEHTSKKIHQTNFGRTLHENDPLQPKEEIVNSRDVDDVKIKAYKLSQTEILEEEYSPLNCLPILVVAGNYEIVNGQPRPYPLGYDAFDKQKVLNLTFAQNESCMRNLRKEDILLDDDQPAEVKKAMQMPLRHRGAILTKWKDGNPGITIKPAGEIPPSLSEAYKMMMQGIDITMGIYDAAQGAPSNEISGIAQALRINQNNIGIYSFIQYTVFALQSLGRALVDLLPKIYIEQRLIELGGSQVMVNPDQDADIEDKKALILDQIKKETVNIEIKVSPTFQVQAQEQMNLLVQLLTLAPENKDLIIPHLLKLSEIPASSKLAQDFIKMAAITNPMAYQILKGATTEQIEQLAKQQQQAKAQQMQVGHSMAANVAQQKGAVEQGKLKVSAEKNQIERMKADNTAVENLHEYQLNQKKQAHTESMDTANYQLAQERDQTELQRALLGGIKGE